MPITSYILIRQTNYRVDHLSVTDDFRWFGNRPTPSAYQKGKGEHQLMKTETDRLVTNLNSRLISVGLEGVSQFYNCNLYLHGLSKLVPINEYSLVFQYMDVIALLNDVKPLCVLLFLLSSSLLQHSLNRYCSCALASP